MYDLAQLYLKNCQDCFVIILLAYRQSALIANDLILPTNPKNVYNSAMHQSLQEGGPCGQDILDLFACYHRFV